MDRFDKNPTKSDQWYKLRAFLPTYPDSGEVVPVERPAPGGPAPADAGEAGGVARLPLFLPELADVDLAQLIVQVHVPPQAVGTHLNCAYKIFDHLPPLFIPIYTYYLDLLILKVELFSTPFAGFSSQIGTKLPVGQAGAGYYSRAAVSSNANDSKTR